MFTGLALYLTHKPRAAAPAHADGADAGAGRMSEVDFKPAAASPTGDFEPEQKRYLEGFVAGVQIAKAAKSVERYRAARRRGRGAGADGSGRSGVQGAGPRARVGRQALRSGKVQARAASVRHLRAPEGARGEERISEAARQFPLAILRSVLRRAEPEFLHVPAAHPERHPQGAAVRRRRRPRRALWRRLCACHHPRQSADPRDRGGRTPSP